MTSTWTWAFPVLMLWRKNLHVLAVKDAWSKAEMSIKDHPWDGGWGQEDRWLGNGM